MIFGHVENAEAVLEERPWCKFKCERLSTICFQCGRIGHMMRSCLEGISISPDNGERKKDLKYGPGC